ncbi:hypothetical protein ACEPAF_4832 [Sanghuangporus sanghuang]
MALKLPQNPGERISQLLPTVKCSTCSQPVKLSDLGEHVCPPLPPSTPRPSALLAKIRQASQAIASPSPLSPGANNSNSSTRTSVNGETSRFFRRSKTPQPAGSNQSATPPPGPPGPICDVPARSRSSSMSRRSQIQIPPPDQMSPPLPTSVSAGGRLEAPSRVGTPQTQPLSPVGHPEPLPRSKTPNADGNNRINNRRPSVSSMRDARVRGPSGSRIDQPPQPDAGMSRSASGADIFPPESPSVDMPPRMSMDRIGSKRPSLDTRPSQESSRGPSPLNPTSPVLQRTPQPPSGPTRRNGLPEVEVNMAGVGRRGFQAVAQAALLAASMRRDQEPDRMQMPTAGMDGKRTNVPGHLNINPDVVQPSTSSLSPNTPLSSHSPRSPSPHSPNAFPQPGIVSSRTPSPLGTPVPGLPHAFSPRSPDTVTPGSARSASPAGSTFSARFKNKDLEIDTTKAEVAIPRHALPTSPSESDYSGTGLAYDQETESALSPTSPSASSAGKSQGREHVIFPSVSPKHSLKGLPTRSASSSSAYSYASRTTAKSTGALDRDRVLDTLFEEHASSPSGATVPLPISPPAGTRSPKLPARSRTTPAMGGKESKEEAAAKRRPRQCTKCNKNIDDGRWIRAEGAGVLCERCWKTMYLPKCRRCNRPIEKHAVSSADGQLKGKYHRECFNCHKCHQPFPDKEFYVFDGKPFCRYHYHEANDSLCAALECGQPIEGPCAVAHTGERYHPEHLVCQFRRCTERLEEYWEIDGLMLCERHANMKMEMDIMAPDEDNSEKNDVLADLVSGLRDGTDMLRAPQHDHDSDIDVDDALSVRRFVSTCAEQDVQNGMFGPTLFLDTNPLFCLDLSQLPLPSITPICMSIVSRRPIAFPELASPDFQFRFHFLLTFYLVCAYSPIFGYHQRSHSRIHEAPSEGKENINIGYVNYYSDAIHVSRLLTLL